MVTVLRGRGLTIMVSSTSQIKIRITTDNGEVDFKRPTGL